METSDLSEDLIGRLGSGGALDGIMGSEFFDPPDNLNMDAEDNESDDVIVLHMDIREPLSNLLKLVETKYGFQLAGYKFWLQDTQELEPNKNLVDQCVKGEGLVQINVQIRIIEQRINIVDVLKPTEEALAAVEQTKGFENFPNEDLNMVENSDMAEDQNSRLTDIDSDTNYTLHTIAAEEGKFVDENFTEEEEVEEANKGQRVSDESSNAEQREEEEQEKPCQDWVLDHEFKKEQVRLQIPEDPVEWTVSHVQHWFQWAINQFELLDFKESDWTITGQELCDMTHQEFREKMPRDPGNIFWTHLQLLRECKFVSVMANVTDKYTSDTLDEDQFSAQDDGDNKEPKIMRKFTNSLKGSVSNSSESSTARGTSLIQSTSSSFGTVSGNNGQMQLWQFLLEILTDREHVSIIQWVGTEGEFKLSNPEEVARLWGIKKNKPAMNYEKLSRALRYYYDGDMISKVSGKRFAYKFDCDLKLLIGYDAAELSRLVNEKPFMSESMYNQLIVEEAVESILEDKDD